LNHIEDGPLGLFTQMMNRRDFERLRKFIEERSGIQLLPSKKIMLESRLRKRLADLGLGSYQEYAEYLFSPEGQGKEVPYLIDSITTNKTDFFRDPQHFEFLVREALPRMETELGAGTGRRLAIWSAGCATGEEPFTTAMVVSEYALSRPAFDFLVLATDISHGAVEVARRGVYPQERVEPVPAAIRKRYLLRSREPEKGLVRVVPAIRERVKFRQLNLLHDFGMREQMDLVFCRNVLIYFDKETQRRLVQRILGQVRVGGYLFLGPTESLLERGLPISQAAPAIFRKKAAFPSCPEGA
jgi:chemotaxis protein methyltransferase CheR